MKDKFIVHDVLPKINEAAFVDLNKENIDFLGQERYLSALALLEKTKTRHVFMYSVEGVDSYQLLYDYFSSTKSILHREFLASQSQTVHDKNRDYNVDYNKKLYHFVSGNINKRLLLGYRKDDNNIELGFFTTCDVLVFSASELLNNLRLYHFLCAVLNHGVFSLDDIVLPIACKMIIVGEPQDYDKLRLVNSTMMLHFSLIADVQSQYRLVDTLSYQKWFSALFTYAKKYFDMILSEEELKILFYYSSRITENQEIATLKWNELFNILAYYQVAIAEKKEQNHSLLSQVIHENEKRSNQHEIFFLEEVKNKYILLETNGSKVGQINALSVISLANYEYGEPLKVTAVVSFEEGEVVDIEKKSELSGNLNNKSTEILNSWLQYEFGAYSHINLHATIAFEQSYQSIDGDSSSLAKACVLISAITNTPIQQGIALTGSFNQFGEVQSVGGINAKVESFFYVCKVQNQLNGQQGVIIPKTNEKDLCLKLEVIEAIKRKHFFVYSVSTIDEAMLILTNKKVKEIDDEGKLREDCLYYMVQQKLHCVVEENKKWYSGFLKFFHR